jgi:diadenosine tetraphosphate (Ap4A) HIT family hydrolase
VTDEAITPTDCAICDVAASIDDGAVVRRTGAFTVAPATVRVPGWFLLWTNRHDAAGLWELTDAEAQEFGQLIRDLSQAVRACVDAERTYVMTFGEHALHFHAMVLARTTVMPPDSRGPALLGRGPDFADAARATAVTEQVRRLLSST